MRLFTRKTLLFTLLAATGLVITREKPSWAEPSPGIKKLMDTPASAFDVLMFQLHNELNGTNYFGGENRSQPIQCFRLEYDPGRDVIDIGMHILPTHELLGGWQQMNAVQKKALMMEAARATAMSVGVESRPSGRPSGCIQHITIRNGWATNDLDEAAIKEELRSRVVFTLVFPISHELTWALREPASHVVTRTLDGKYVYESEKRDQ